MPVKNLDAAFAGNISHQKQYLHALILRLTGTPDAYAAPVAYVELRRYAAFCGGIASVLRKRRAPIHPTKIGCSLNWNTRRLCGIASVFA